MQAMYLAEYAVANNIMTDTLRVTPKYDGWLRNTRFVSKPRKSQPYSDAGFGADYALAVHEMPDDVNWSEPGTGNKFLQRTLDKHQQTAASEMARIAKQALESDRPVTLPQGPNPTKPETGEGP